MQKPLVSGNAGVFKFYTMDKPGFISSGFDKKRAWRNFPICPECKLELIEGRKFIEQNLTFRFYGLRYLLIPKIILGTIEDSEIIDILLASKKIIFLKENVKKKITNDEKDILDIIKENNDTFAINFLFLSRELSAEIILLFIEDIFPSRIRQIFEAKDFVDNIINKNFNFGNIRTFFSKSDDKKRIADLDKYFLEIVDKIFREIKIDLSFLLRFFMARIRKDFINYDSRDKERYNFQSSIQSSLMNLMFLEKLCLLNFKEVNKMEESMFEELFNKYGNTFASPVKRGLFLAGVLTQMLLNKQSMDRGSKPFLKKLKGLKMDQRDIMSLLPEVQNKFEEYKSFGKGKKLVAKESYNYLFSAGNNWKLSVNEINYYFAGGMNLTNEVIKVLYPKDKQDIDLEGNNELVEENQNNKEEE